MKNSFDKSSTEVYNNVWDFLLIRASDTKQREGTCFPVLLLPRTDEENLMNHSIAVIIPVYNAERYIEHAVNSVLTAEGVSTQLVLVNDGSKDNSGAICDSLSQKYPNIHVIHQENGGVSKARNTGIDYVLNSGNFSDDDYVAFLDSDDFWNTKANLRIVNDCDANLIAFSSAICNEKVTRYRIIHRFNNTILLGEEIHRQWINNGHFAAFFYQIGFMKKYNLQFIAGVKRNEDMIFWRQATLCANKVVLSSDILYIYRMNPNSVTHSSASSHLTSLDVPKAWEQGIDWIYSIPEATDEQKSKWIEICHRTIGATILETARILAENGATVEELNNLIIANPLYRHIRDNDVHDLAVWQQNDYLLIQKDINEFVKYHQHRAKRTKLLLKISKIPILQTIRNRFRFNLTELP